MHKVTNMKICRCSSTYLNFWILLAKANVRTFLEGKGLLSFKNASLALIIQLEIDELSMNYSRTWRAPVPWAPVILKALAGLAKMIVHIESSQLKRACHHCHHYSLAPRLKHTPTRSYAKVIVPAILYFCPLLVVIRAISGRWMNRFGG